MFVTADRRGSLIQTPDTMSSATRPAALDRRVLWAAAAHRRARAQEIEAEIDAACESAAIGCVPKGQTRETWDKRAWDRYVAEAINQAPAHGSDLQALWRDTAHLERLAGGET